MNPTLRVWHIPLFITVIAIAVVLGLYASTALSMVAIWERSETYTHGFLIFPISLYLIWRSRRTVADLAPKPNYWIALLLLGLGFLWFLSHLAGVLVTAQYALVIAIPLFVAAILGPRVVRRFAFPFAFMLLAVPFGEVFLPALINFTADFTVLALKITGIPVFREGNMFSLPTGNWSVVEACSGLRYLIASFTLGTLYAYLTYRSTARKLIFVLASLLVPIIANGLRAYMIVMIGHLSGMKYAVGVDHLIYGWVFFGAVMLLLFWLGGLWREDLTPAPSRPNDSLTSAPAAAASNTKILIAALISVIAFGSWPLLAQYMDRAPTSRAEPKVNLPLQMGEWQARDLTLSSWAPNIFHAKAQAIRTYQRGAQQVQLSIYYYRDQVSGKQMISSANVMASEGDKDWAVIGQSTRHLSTPGLEIIQSRMRGPGRYMLSWHWYWIGDRYVTNPYLAKLLQARDKLLGRGDDGAIVILAAPYEDNPKVAMDALEHFARDNLAEITASLHAVSVQR